MQKTVIHYRLDPRQAAGRPAELIIHNPAGAVMVRVLLTGNAQGTAGTFVWDGRDNHGNRVPPGSYQAVLRHGGTDRTLNLIRSK